jgi:hypothetical protein
MLEDIKAYVMTALEHCPNASESERIQYISELSNMCLKLCDEVKQLQADSKLLNALIAAGVDNWEGYQTIDLAVE